MNEDGVGITRMSTKTVKITKEGLQSQLLANTVTTSSAFGSDSLFLVTSLLL